MNTPAVRLSAVLADRYRIDREVGLGGMATVYLAHDVKHDRRVAIKVLRPELSAAIGAERFLSEIRTTANLLATDGRTFYFTLGSNESDIWVVELDRP